MIDVHFHVLPGIDDGPAEVGEAMDLCRAAVADGIRTIVATPHVLCYPWMNEDRASRAALVAEMNGLLNGSLLLLAGCELWWGDDVLDLLEKGADGPLETLAGSRYLLVEFPPAFVPPSVRAMIHEIRIAGTVPVIAHPERNPVFAGDHDRLQALVDAGAAVQITAASILGDFGPAARSAAERFLDLGLVDVVASDAHGPRRPPRMSAARERIRRKLGTEVEEGLFEGNPGAIVANQDLPWNGRG